MFPLLLLIGVIAIILLVNNFITILNKIKKDEDTINNTFICCITLIYLWFSIVILCSY